jgi:iron complex outermembrane receptor protein
MKQLLITLAVLWSFSSMAQTVVTGKVTNATTGEPIPGASLKIVGKELGTTTDFDGNYTLKVNEAAPFSLEASSVGFKNAVSRVSSANQTLNFSLEEEQETLDEVIVSASRTPERIRESPVTIERIDAKFVQNSAAADFYDGLENLKGVDINTNSMTFKSINTRGFATFSNARFMQLVDGMDNTSPALNFALGNLLGMNELDVNSIEILPGASSALYGANAFNGILFMTSKSPFERQGISTYFKTGMTMQEVTGDNQFYDTGIRMAYKFSDKLAGKANFSFLKGTDWGTADRDQYKDNIIGEPQTITPWESRTYAHDGLNIYGDEVATTLNLQAIGNSLSFPSVYTASMGTHKIGRTGYMESDLTDYEAKSIKADFALHYKPWANDKEIIFNFRTGRGNTIYQGGNRYSIKDFTLNQMKLEFKGKNFFIRGYRTTEDAGDSYDMRFAGINMNKVNAAQWFAAYVQGFMGATQQALMGGMTPSIYSTSQAQFHDAARAYADAALTPQPGTAAFNTLFNTVISNPDLQTGAKFVDHSSMSHVDANYNLHSLLNEWADFQIGGSYRVYSLNSDGTIFTDYDGNINYNEYGAYAQLSKKFSDDRLKFTGSVRYDKAQNFDGSFSPRLALVYAAGSDKNHIFRASYQTGFRNPTTQDQYIGLDLGQAILVGSAPDNLDRFTSKPLAVSTSTVVPGYPYGSQIVGANTVTLTGRAAYENAYTYSSVLAFSVAAGSGDPTAPLLLEKSTAEYVRPEGISAYELGYRGKIGNFNVDLSGYYNMYDGFIATKTVIAPKYGEIGNPNNFSIIALANGDYQPFQIYTNSLADISSYGGSIGVSTKVGKFDIGANYTYAKFDFDQTTDPDYDAGFNTPEHKAKLSLGSEELFKNFGFGINYRYQTEFLWQSNFVDAMVPARSLIDAQINYKVSSLKSEFKVGGSNIGGKDYIVAPGTGMIGSQYYISWTVNP